MNRARPVRRNGVAAAEPHSVARRPSSRLGTVALAALLLAAVSVAVVVTHWPALSATALSFDDQQYLAENYLVQKPSWASAGRFLREVLEPSTVGGYYQPLAMISLMLDYAQAGRLDNLRPFHRTSLALHVMNTAMIIALLYLLLSAASPAPAVVSRTGMDAGGGSRGPLWAAAIAGLLFGLHPLTVEPIPWVGERKTLLAAFFSLLCLTAYVGYARRGSRTHYGSSLVAYALALLSKPTSTPLPVLMLLLDFWPLRRLGRRAILEKIPFFVVGGISAVITVISQARTAAVEMPGEHPPMRIPLILCHNIVFYLYKIVRPVNLSSHYPFPEPLALSDPMVLAGVIGTCVLIPALLLSLRWTRAPLTGWLFFFIAIFPTMGVIGFTNVIASDKYAYLPSVGLLMILAWLLGRAWDAGASAPRRSAIRGGLLLLTVAVGVAEARGTRRYLVCWQSTDRLYRHMIDLAPRAPSPHFGLGFFLASRGEYSESMVEFLAALQLRPQQAEAHTNLGAVLLELGRTDEAITHLQEALRLQPRIFAVRNNLGQALVAQGKYDEAIGHFREALRLRPDSPRAHANLAAALVKRGDTRDAVGHYEAAIRIKPNNPEAHCRLADALAALGRSDEAVEHYRAALRQRPEYSEAHTNLATELTLRGRVEEAARHAREALRIRPDYAKAHYNLGVTLLRQRKTAEAAGHFEEAIRLQPDLADAHNNLAILLLEQGRTDDAATHLVEATRAEPAVARYRYNLGRVRESQGRADEAAREYGEALRLDPRHTGSQERLKALTTTTAPMSR